MQIDREKLRLYLVTDRRWSIEKGGSLEEDVEKAIRGGATMVQLREKELSTEECLEEGKRIREICSRYQIPFIVNDSVDLCIALHADGVHLGQDDGDIKAARKILGEQIIIGATAHNVDEASAAVEAGADYLGVGAAFGSSTKKDAIAFDLREYRRITNTVSVPVVAIGGIDATNIEKLCGAGLAGVAVISGILAQPDVEAAAKQLKEKAKML